MTYSRFTGWENSTSSPLSIALYTAFSFLCTYRIVQKLKSTKMYVERVSFPSFSFPQFTCLPQRQRRLCFLYILPNILYIYQHIKNPHKLQHYVSTFAPCFLSLNSTSWSSFQVSPHKVTHRFCDCVILHANCTIVYLTSFLLMNVQVTSNFLLL